MYIYTLCRIYLHILISLLYSLICAYILDSEFFGSVLTFPMQTNSFYFTFQPQFHSYFSSYPLASLAAHCPTTPPKKLIFKSVYFYYFYMCVCVSTCGYLHVSGRPVEARRGRHSSLSWSCEPPIMNQTRLPRRRKQALLTAKPSLQPLHHVFLFF